MDKREREIIEDESANNVIENNYNRDDGSTINNPSDETTPVRIMNWTHDQIKLAKQDNNDQNFGSTSPANQLNHLIDDITNNKVQSEPEVKPSDIIFFGVQYHKSTRMISIPDCMVINDLIILLQKVFGNSQPHQLYYNDTALDSKHCFSSYSLPNGSVLVFKEYSVCLRY